VIFQCNRMLKYNKLKVVQLTNSVKTLACDLDLKYEMFFTTSHFIRH
jgi:hypothetical protein